MHDKITPPSQPAHGPQHAGEGPLLKAVWQYSLDENQVFRFTFVTDSVQELLAIERAELLGNPGILASRIHPEDLPVVMASLEHAVAHCGNRHLCYRVILPCGRMRWIEEHASVSRMPDGRQLWNSTLAEIRETRFRRAHDFMADRDIHGPCQVANGALFMTWIRRRDGKLRWLSPGLAAFVGLAECSQSPEILEAYWQSRIHPDDLAVYLDTYQQIPGLPYRLEYRIRQCDGMWRWIVDQGASYPGKRDCVDGHVGACLDVDAWKSVEYDLLRATLFNEQVSERCQEMIQEERRLQGQMLHDDLGQYLTAIKLRLLAVDCAHAACQSEMAALNLLIDEAQRSLARATALIRPPFASVDGLSEPIRTMVERLQNNSLARINLDIRECDCLEKNVSKKEQLIVFRALQEALSNSLKHSGARNIDLRIWSQGNCLHAEVRDDGQGFDVDQVLSRKSGFGLPGIHERLFIHGGLLRINSQPGEGTSVAISLVRQHHCPSCLQ